MRRWTLAVLAVGHVAFADTPKLVIPVGKTVEREVGIAIGYRCDEPTAIVEIAMRQKSESTNVAVITGKKAGVTTCRFGLDPMSYSVVYEIRVVAQR